jgi:hypothetical protein
MNQMRQQLSYVDMQSNKMKQKAIDAKTIIKYVERISFYLLNCDLHYLFIPKSSYQQLMHVFRGN